MLTHVAGGDGHTLQLDGNDGAMEYNVQCSLEAAEYTFWPWSFYLRSPIIDVAGAPWERHWDTPNVGDKREFQ